MTAQKIVPCLWFDREAEEAAQLYTSLFKNSQVGQVNRYSEAGKEIHGQAPGSVMTVDFELDGYAFTALNGGPHFKFNPSISFFLNLPGEADVDALWEQLSEGGSVLMPLDSYPFSPRYGWLADRYGLSWQISVAQGQTTPIIPSLLFVGERAGQAEEAINYYTSVFSGSEVGDLFRHQAGQEHDREGTIAYGPFVLSGQQFGAMDSAHPGHQFTFNEAISFIVNCQDQNEVDYFWEKLSAVPESEQCGWLKDRFGVSWQIVPTVLNRLMAHPDQEKADRVMEALLEMKKLDIAQLEAAAS